MAVTPRSTIEDSYASGKRCAICGAGALRVGHVPNLPDYVTCGECSSAFLVEDGGERIFYGKVAGGYADAESFALRQWAFAEAIENRARPDRPTLPDFEGEPPAPEAAAPEPAPEPEPAADEEPQPAPADERPTTPYIEFETPEPPAATPVEEPTLEAEAPQESEPETGSEFDFLAEIAAEGPAPEPTPEVESTPPAVGEPALDVTPEPAVEGMVADEPFEFEPAPPDLAAPGKDEVEQDFLLGTMAGDQDLGSIPEMTAGPAESAFPEPEEMEPEADFPSAMEAVEAPAESEPAGLVDGDEPHPADKLIPPPWAAQSTEPEKPEAEEPSTISWHEFVESKEAADEPAPELALDAQDETESEPEAVIPGEPYSLEAEDDPLGLASAFEALTPVSGEPEAGEASKPTAETPAWMQFEDDETPAAEQPEVPDWTQFEDESLAPDEEPVELDAFASLRTGVTAEEVEAPEAENPEKDAGDQEFEPFEFNQRLSALSSEEDEQIEQLSEGPAEDEDDFLSGLRRSAAIPLESEPLADTPLSGVRLESQPVFKDETASDDEGSGEDPLAMAARLGAVTAEPAAEAMPEWMQEAEAEPEGAEPRGAFHLRETDPPPGQRYRVVLLGDRVVFPSGDCAHCGRTPVKGRLAVYGTLPNGQKVGQRKVTSFNVPLCAECRERAALRTEEAGNARLQAHLISAIIGMVLVVLSLVIGLIDPRALTVPDFMILAILFIVGYAGPVTFLLNRAGNYPPPPDAVYVRTTLLVPSETQGLETAFEWRNQEYAQRFFDANQSNAIGRLTSVKDRLAPVG